MNKALSLLVFVFIFCHDVFAQTDYVLEWEKYSETSLGFILSENPADGSILRCGYVPGTLGNDIYCERYSKSGEWLSNFLFSSPFYYGSFLIDVLIDEEGNTYYVINAQTYEYLGDEQILLGSVVFVIKSDPWGEVLWENTYTKDEEHFAMATHAVLENNRLYLAGVLAERVINNTFYDEAFAFAMSESGSIVWETYLPERRWVFPFEIRGDSIPLFCRKIAFKDYELSYLNKNDGSIISSFPYPNSDSYTDNHYSDKSGNHYLQGSNPEFCTLKKYNENGDSLWSYLREFSASQAWIETKQLVFDSVENVYRLGTYYEPEMEEWMLWMDKLNANGELIWETQFQGGGIASAWPNNPVFILSENRILFGAYTYTEGTDVKNFLLLEYDTSGQLLQEIVYPGSDPEEDDYPGQILLNADGDLFVAGIAYKDGVKNSVLLKYSVPVAAEEPQGDLTALYLFPNPNEGHCAIRGEDVRLVSEVAIYNSLGQLVQSEAIDAAREVISLEVSALPPACYWVQLRSQSGASGVLRMLVR